MAQKIPPSKSTGRGRNPDWVKPGLRHGLWATRTADYKKVALELRKDIAYLEGLLEKVSQKLDAVVASDKLMTAKERANLTSVLHIIDRRIHAIRTQAFLTGDIEGELAHEIEAGTAFARHDLGILDACAAPRGAEASSRDG